MPDPTPALVDRENPWPGLSSYTESAQAYFFGREAEIREILSRIEARPFTLLYAKSGLGKTSLLQAGIAPSLKKKRLLPVPLRLDHAANSPGLDEQIAHALLAALAAAGLPSPARPPLAAQGESLWEWLHRIDTPLKDASGKPLTPVLILDQFEEIFTLGQRDADARARSHRWLQSLAYLVENWCPAEVKTRMEQNEALLEEIDPSAPGLRVLISLREDYLPHLDELANEMPSIPMNRMRLTPLRGTQALEVVHQPAPQLVTRQVAEAIVRFAAGDKGSPLAEIQVAPPILNLVCRELNERRKARSLAAITPDLIEGDAGKILRQFYEECIKSHPPALRAFVEEELLSESGYRENISEERALRLMEQAGVPASALEDLVSRRLLQKEERLGRLRLELIHDVLCTPIAQSRAERHQLEKAGRDERERQQALAKIRQLRLRAALFLGAFVVSLGLLVYALAEKSAAVKEAAVAAENQANAAQASNRAENFKNTVSLDETLALLFGIKDLQHPGQMEVESSAASAQNSSTPGLDDAIGYNDLKDLFSTETESGTNIDQWYQEGMAYARVAAFEMSAYSPPHPGNSADAVAAGAALADKLHARKDDQDAVRLSYILYAFLAKPCALMNKRDDADAFEKKALDAAAGLQDPADAEYAASLVTQYYYENVDSSGTEGLAALDQSVDHAQKSVDDDDAKKLVNSKHLEQLGYMLSVRSDKLDTKGDTAGALRDATASCEAYQKEHDNYDDDWKDQPETQLDHRETLAKAYSREGHLCQRMKGNDDCWAQGRTALENALSTYNSMLPAAGQVISPQLKADIDFDVYRQDAAIAARDIGDYELAWGARKDIAQPVRDDCWKQAADFFDQSAKIADPLPVDSDYYQTTKSFALDSYATVAWAKFDFAKDAPAIRAICQDYIAETTKAVDVLESGSDAGSRAWHDFDHQLNGMTVEDAIKADKAGVIRFNLADYYGNISYRLLFLGRFSDALAAAQKALMIDNSQKWIITNLAHADLFLGNVTVARQLYGIYANVEVNGQLFSKDVKDDFDAFKRAGITSPQMDEILRELDAAAAKKPDAATAAPASPSPSASPAP